MAEPTPAPVSWGRRLLIAPIRGYQRFISPALPASCRFYPTCSAYAVTAISVHGPIRGLWLAVRRLGKCQPFHAGGIDHVPPRRERKSRSTSAGDKTDPLDVDQRGTVSADAPTDPVGTTGRHLAASAAGRAHGTRSKTRGT